MYVVGFPEEPTPRQLWFRNGLIQTLPQSASQEYKEYTFTYNLETKKGMSGGGFA